METNLNSSLFTEMTNSEATTIVGGGGRARALSEAFADALARNTAVVRTLTQTFTDTSGEIEVARGFSGSLSSSDED